MADEETEGVAPLPRDPAFLTTGAAYRRQDLHRAYGGQRQEGISTPKNALNVILVFTGRKGRKSGYFDEWTTDGSLLYFGRGASGPMVFTHGNRALRDHAASGKEIHVFEEVSGTVLVRYRGEFATGGYEWREAPGEDGALRPAIVFHLIPREPEDSSSESFGAKATDYPDSFEELRRLASEAADETPSSKTSRRRYWLRSEAVRRYVLMRSAGRCEGCGSQAPFVRSEGSPYLEPHHTRRVADGGPDDPDFVIALCPNCHRRVHHGADGDSYNARLVETLQTCRAVRH